MKNPINVKTSDLTEDQKIIYNSEINFGENVLVEGGPGTGKTTLLFLIAQKIKKLGYKFRIITWGNNLKNFLRDSFGDLDEFVFNAWGTSDLEKYPEKKGLMFNGVIELLDEDFPIAGSFFHKTKEDDYRNKLLKDLLEKAKEYAKGKKFKDEIILIDEAQDLPPLYFEIVKIFFNTIYIFGDTNQQINEWGTEINEIGKILNISGKNKYFLDINFRNTKQIYNFAEITGFRDKNIELIKNGSKINLYIGNYDKVKEVKNILSENIGKNIAIISNDQEEYKVDFFANGIQIVLGQKYIKYNSYDNFYLNFRNNKGLEFDIVILLDFDENQFFTKEMYVSITRAKDKVFVLNKKIRYFLELEKYNFIDIIEKNDLEYEITADDLPF